jgi:hypothetical protein
VRDDQRANLEIPVSRHHLRERVVDRRELAEVNKQRFPVLG